jgi:hypothetical protein
MHPDHSFCCLIGLVPTLLSEHVAEQNGDWMSACPPRDERRPDLSADGPAHNQPQNLAGFGVHRIRRYDPDRVVHGRPWSHRAEFSLAVTANTRNPGQRELTGVHFLDRGNRHQIALCALCS